MFSLETESRSCHLGKQVNAQNNLGGELKFQFFFPALSYKWKLVNQTAEEKNYIS